MNKIQVLHGYIENLESEVRRLNDELKELKEDMEDSAYSLAKIVESYHPNKEMEEIEQTSFMKMPDLDFLNIR